jgi:carboxyl-terminal processing protease
MTAGFFQQGSGLRYARHGISVSAIAMNQRQIAPFLGFVLTVAISVSAQLTSPLFEPSEPFRITTGSTFSASGKGSARVNPATTKRITDELREAQAIILGNHIGAKDLDPASLSKAALTEMLHSLDPHSNFHSRSEWKELLEDQNSGYTGIGATIADFSDGRSRDTYVISVSPNSPAAIARLAFGDRIIAVNGQKMSGMGSAAVRDSIRGEIGTTVRITIERAASLRIETIDIRRNSVSHPSVPDAYILQPSIGYIALTEGFSYTTAVEFDRALRDLKRQGMRSLILDLRGNRGGILEQAVKVAEKFLPTGTEIVSQRGRSPLDMRLWRSGNATPESMPLVVLVNRSTASASEIVAGAFQDDDRAIIVGGKTYGKGLVQTVIDLPGGSGLTLTTARYFTPSGRSIQRDYSNVNLYDYYNHKNHTSAIDRPFFESRTVTNRRVFGGDGIQPDEPVKGEQITAVQQTLLDPIFLFARDLASGRVPGHQEFRSSGARYTKRIMSDDLPISSRVLETFSNSLLENARFRFTRKDLDDQQAFIRLRLRHYVVMALLGSTIANQVLIDSDRQVAKAISVIPNASRLQQMAIAARQAIK